MNFWRRGGLSDLAGSPGNGTALLRSSRAPRMCHQSPGREVTRAVSLTLLAGKTLKSQFACLWRKGQRKKPCWAMGSILLSWGRLPGCPDPVSASSLAQQSFLGVQGWGVQPCPSWQGGRGETGHGGISPRENTGACEEEWKIVAGSSFRWRGRAEPMPAYGFGGSCQRKLWETCQSL